MTTACIVQARLKSTRLPGKAQLVLPTMNSVLNQTLVNCRFIPGVDVVVAAIADDEASDVVFGATLGFLEAVKRERFPPGFPEIAPVKVWRGSETDVLDRHIQAARSVGADTIMRVTSDCPLIEPEVCGLVLERYRQGDVDYCTNAMPRTWPHGLDCEVFSYELLCRAAEADEAAWPGNKEGVDVWMQGAPDVRRANVAAPGPNASHLRWTLDTIEDYVVICREILRRASVGHHDPRAGRLQ